MWSVEYAEEFELWWETLDESAQDAIDRCIYLLEQFGPSLTRPYVDRVKGSRHANMKELRIQHRGAPLRTLFAFDPNRTAILLIGGDKTSDGGFYVRMVPLADDIYDQHLAALKKKRSQP